MAEKTPATALPDVSVPDIDRVIQTAIFEQTCSAAACVASIGDQVFHRAVYGSPTTPPPLRRLGHDTLFDLGTLTQPFGVGLATLMLVARNRLDLNASLSKTIPELKDARFAAVTLDMLLDHTSGLPTTRSYWQDLREAEQALPEAQRTFGTAKAAGAMRALLGDTRLEYEPGQRVQESDVGLLALGFIIEALIGQPLDVFLEREVYRPLGIADDLFFVRHDDPKRRARLARRVFAATEECAWRERLLQGEVRDANAWAIGGVAGHAGLFGTAEAVWRLTQTLWASFRGEGRFFLGGTVRRFWTRSKRLRDTTRALVWDTPSAIAPTVGKRFSSGSVGFTSPTSGAVWVDLATDAIGVLLLNAAHPTPDGKEEAMGKLLPRVFDFIAKHGESRPRDATRPTGARAFYDGPIASGTTVPLHNPLRGPRK